MKLIRSTKILSHQQWIVISILVFSFLVRAVLIFRGGQFYFSDEGRYQISRDVAELMVKGNFQDALAQLTTTPEHLGFKVLGLVPAMAENILGTSRILPALFFSLFSVLNLYLIYKLSQRAGASFQESVLALLLATASHSLLYYVRHLMPYDMAMSLGLLALYVGLAEKATIKTSITCGILALLCFVTYNGYWSLAGFAMSVHVLKDSRIDFGLVRRALWTAIGFTIPLGLLFALFRVSGINLFSEYSKFAKTIDQGSYTEGWSLPFEYFWHSEHAIILILGGLSLWVIVNLFRSRNKYTGVWVAGLTVIYLCLLIPSVFLHSFVVYARLARQMLPFIILLSATGLTEIEQHSKPFIKWLILAAILFQGVWNFATSYRLSYPREFVAQIQADFHDFEFSTKRMAFGAPLVCQNNGYVIENVKYFLTPPEAIPQIKGELLRSALHPVNFLPYQYEGYTLDQRQRFRRQEITMEFYQVGNEFALETNPVESPIKNCMVNEK